MVHHIFIIVRAATVNIRKDDEFARRSCMTEVLNLQTVSDRNRKLVQFFRELMKRAGVLHLGVMMQECRCVLQLNLQLQKKLMK